MSTQPGYSDPMENLPAPAARPFGVVPATPAGPNIPAEAPPVPGVRVTEQTKTTWTNSEAVNAHPWSGQETSAYNQLAQRVISALDPYHQRTSDAGQLVMVTQELAAKVRSTFETAAWQALADAMAKANALAGWIITPHLPNRARSTTAYYPQMLAAVTEGVAEWRRWMDLSEQASAAITAAAQDAYNARMQYAYDDMTATNTAARDNWLRANNGALRASQILGPEQDRSGAVQPPTTT